MTFGERLIELRKTKNLTREALANQLDISKFTLRNYELSVNEPGSFLLKQVADFFDVSIDYLMGMTDEKEKVRPYNLKSSEYEHIKKYRSLDDTGRQHIDTMMSWETERVFLQTIHIENEEQENEVPVYIMSYYQRLASAGSGEYLFDDIPTDKIEVPITDLSEQADFVIGINGDSMEPTYSDGDKVYVKAEDEIPVGSIGVFVRGNECFIKELGVDRLKSHNTKYADIPASEDIKSVGLVLGKVE